MVNPRHDVIGIGNAIVDVIARADDDFLVRHQMAKGSMSLIDEARAEAIYRDLKRRFNVMYDEKGAIGRRYRRQDEAGTPFGITVDGQTAQDGTVTVRDRDSCRQWRVPAAGIAQALADLIESGGAPGPATS